MRRELEILEPADAEARERFLRQSPAERVADFDRRVALLEQGLDKLWSDKHGR